MSGNTGLCTFFFLRRKERHLLGFLYCTNRSTAYMTVFRDTCKQAGIDKRTKILQTTHECNEWNKKENTNKETKPCKWTDCVRRVWCWTGGGGGWLMVHVVMKFLMNYSWKLIRSKANLYNYSWQKSRQKRFCSKESSMPFIYSL